MDYYKMVENLFMEAWKKATKLLKQHKLIFLSLIIIYLIGIPFSYLLPEAIRQEEVSSYKELLTDLKITDNPNNILVFLITFLSNALVGLILTIIPLILFFPSLPILIIFYYGTFTGIVATWYLNQYPQNTLINYLSGILPHGIIELSAIFFAAYLGSILGFKLIFRNKIVPDQNFKELIKDILKVYLFVIIPLLLVAALIETYITPLIMELFL